jgi:hypothetical protein
MKKMRVFRGLFLISLTALPVLYALSCTKSAPEESGPPRAEQEIELKIEKRKDIPTPRDNLGVASDSSWVYAAGGFTGEGPMKTFEVYNIRDNKWEKRADMPTPRYNPGVAVVDGIVYAIGGRNNGDHALKCVEAYDSKTKQWTRKSDMHHAREDFGIALVSGEVYVFSGHDRNSLLTPFVEKYDPKTDRWTELRNMPVPGHTISVAVIQEKPYALFGRVPGLKGSQLRMYEPEKDSWKELPEMPVERDEIHVAAVGKMLYCAPYPDGRLFVYDTEAKTWSEKKMEIEMVNTGPSGGTQPKQGFCFIALGNRLAEIGGAGHYFKPLFGEMGISAGAISESRYVGTVRLYEMKKR